MIYARRVCQTLVTAEQTTRRVLRDSAKATHTSWRKCHVVDIVDSHSPSKRGKGVGSKTIEGLTYLELRFLNIQRL